jgi:hypothetical protein
LFFHIQGPSQHRQAEKDGFYNFSRIVLVLGSFHKASVSQIPAASVRFLQVRFLLAYAADGVGEVGGELVVRDHHSADRDAKRGLANQFGIP